VFDAGLARQRRQTLALHLFPLGASLPRVLHAEDAPRAGQRTAQRRLVVEIAKLIDSGELKLTIDRILPLSEVRRAHELSKSGHTRGKIVLRVKEEKS
jgi:NADPH:quinone reductase-like Zn-dependent oxidoreductase